MRWSCGVQRGRTCCAASPPWSTRRWRWSTQRHVAAHLAAGRCRGCHCRRRRSHKCNWPPPLLLLAAADAAGAAPHPLAPAPQAAALTPEQVADLIDAGDSAGGAAGRHWVLDPIDGTRGFVGMRQYAVCLGLLVDGVAVLGVLGCPNLPQYAISEADCDEGQAARSFSDEAIGTMFAAAEGQVRRRRGAGGGQGRPAAAAAGAAAAVGCRRASPAACFTRYRH